MNIVEPDPDTLTAWLIDKPDIIVRMVNLLPPWKLFRLKSSGHLVPIQAYNENGTVTVAVTGDFNLVGFERSVFGVKPEGLEEADLPADGTTVGNLNLEIDEIHKIMKGEKIEPRNAPTLKTFSRAAFPRQ